MELQPQLTTPPTEGGMALPDGTLLDAARLGQPEAFDQLMRAYESRVYRQCMRRGLSPDEAADVTQDVFLKAYRWLDRYEHQNAFSTWLYRITENACIDHCRKRGRRSALIQPVPQDESGAEHEYAGTVADPEQALEQAELADQLEDALKALSPLLREPFLMKELEGLRYEQIAERLGCTLGTIKSRIYRARQELMQSLSSLR